MSGALEAATVTATVRHTPDYSGATGPATFIDLAAEAPVIGLLSIEGGLGRAIQRPAAGGSYLYWSAGVGAAWKMLTAAVRYHGSDLKTCGLPCGDRVVVALGVAF